MKRKLIGAGTRWLLTFLLAAGLTLPLLTVLDVSFSWPSAVVVNAALSLIPAICRFDGKIRHLTILGTVAALAVWLWRCGVNDTIELARGVVLQLTEATGVMPLVAARAVPVLAGVMTLLAMLAASPAAGGVPALCLWITSLMLLWMGGHDDAMLCTVPALTSGLTLLIMGGKGGKLRTLLPFAAILSVLSCLLVPSGGVTVQPLKETADQLREQVSDYLFYTAPRSVFSLADLGWYPQGQNQLGGKPDPADDLLLTVKTTRRTYLRGAVKDRYTGRSWLDTLGSRRYLWMNPAMSAQKETIFDTSKPFSGKLVPGKVEVTSVSTGSSTLVVPQRLRQLSVTADMILYFNDASEVFITRDLAPGDSYAVSAPLVAAGDPGLRELITACASVPDLRYEAVMRAYTDLPQHLTSQVYTLARQAAGQGSDYDRAMNLQNWLQSNCVYTLDVERQSSSIDFITQFLTETRRGYCTYFASAMTVMCRMAGLPARYVEGFLADPQSDGTAYVTGLQGHAWTEVYLSGFGWLTFDATPPASISGSAGIRDLPPMADLNHPTPEPTEEPTPEPSPEPTPQPSDEPEQDEAPTEDPEDEESEADEDPDDGETDEEEAAEPEDEPSQQDQGGFPWFLLLLLAACAFIGFAAWQVWSRTPERMAAQAEDDASRCSVWLKALNDALEVMGRKRHADESPMAYMNRLAEEGLPLQLKDIGALQTVLSYSRYTPAQHEATLTRRAFMALTGKMSKRQLVMLHLKRGLVLPDLPLRKIFAFTGRKKH